MKNEKVQIPVTTEGKTWHGVFLPGREDPIATFLYPADAERYRDQFHASVKAKMEIHQVVLVVNAPQPAPVDQGLLDMVREVCEETPSFTEMAMFHAMQGLLAFHGDKMSHTDLADEALGYATALTELRDQERRCAALLESMTEGLDEEGK